MSLLCDNAMRGMPLEPTTVASIDSYILAAVLLFLVLLAFNARHVARIFRTFFRDVWSTRERDNVFEERVASENQAMLLLLLLTSVLEGMTLGAYLDRSHLIRMFLLGTAAAVVFNLFSLVACAVVGYVFTSSAMAIQWRRGLFATQAMLGFLLIIPTVLLVVEPTMVKQAFYLALALYVAARLLYIIKGIRIFYNQFYSWVYFILYLCTLEIAPVIVLWRILVDMC